MAQLAEDKKESMIVFIPPWVRDSPKASLDVQQSQIIVNERLLTARTC